MQSAVRLPVGNLLQTFGRSGSVGGGLTDKSSEILIPSPTIDCSINLPIVAGHIRIVPPNLGEIVPFNQVGTIDGSLESFGDLFVNPIGV